MDSINNFPNLSATFKTNGTNQSPDSCNSLDGRYSHDVVTGPAPMIFMVAWNILYSASAIILNTLVFIAVRRNNSLRLPSKLLLLSLILTDLGTGAIAQPQLVALFYARAASSHSVACLLLRPLSSTMTVFCTASLLMMTAISLDRFTAFFFHLKYKEIVTAKRVRILLAFLWSYSLVSASTFYWSFALYNYGTVYVAIACLLIITAVYIKIYRGLRHHHGHQVQDQAQEQAAATALDVAKYRRTASSMMWIYGLFLFCYAPHLFVYAPSILYLSNNPVPMRVLSDISVTLILSNSSLNPLVYCFRLPEIRSEVLRIVRKVLRRKN